MIIKKWLALFLALVLLFSLASCQFFNREEDIPSSSQPAEEIDPEYPVAIGDIRISQRPEAVVSLSPALTEVLIDLGCSDRLAGISDFDDYPSSITSLPRAGTSQLPNLEEIENISPSVVFASSSLTQEDTVKLQQMDIEVVVLKKAATLDELENIYLTIATIMDGAVSGEENGRRVFDPLLERAQRLASAVQANVTQRLKGVYVRVPDFTVATGDTLEGRLLSMIGIDNIAQEYGEWVFPADNASEFLPQIIFYDQSIDIQQFASSEVYKNLDAVKNNQLVPVESLLFERQSSRMFSLLEEMAAAAYPQIDFGGETSSDTQDSALSQQDASLESSGDSESDDQLLTMDGVSMPGTT